MASESDSFQEFPTFSRYTSHRTVDSESGLSPWKQHMLDLLEDPSSSGLAQVVHYFIISTIVAASVLTVVETVPTMRAYTPFFYAMDLLVTIVFTAEIALRFYIADSCLTFCNFHNVIDVVSTLPGYLELLMSASQARLHQAAASIRMLRIIRVVRLIRVVRMMKLIQDNHYAQQLALLFQVMLEVWSSGLQTFLLLLGLTTLLASSLLYLFEAPQQCLEGWSAPSREIYAIPSQECQAQSNFDSIPAVFWWAVITLTTVGYGDMIPTSIMGKVIGGLMCVCAVMITSVASAQCSIHFRDRWTKAKARDHFRRELEQHRNSIMALEHEVVEQMVGKLQRGLDDLLAKIAGISVEVGGGSTPLEVAPFLMSIKEHAAALNVGYCSFIYDALASVILSGEEASAAEEVDELMRADSHGMIIGDRSDRRASRAPTTASIVRQLSPQSHHRRLAVHVGGTAGPSNSSERERAPTDSGTPALQVRQHLGWPGEDVAEQGQESRGGAVQSAGGLPSQAPSSWHRPHQTEPARSSPTTEPGLSAAPGSGAPAEDLLDPQQRLDVDAGGDAGSPLLDSLLRRAELPPAQDGRREELDPKGAGLAASGGPAPPDPQPEEEQCPPAQELDPKDAGPASRDDPCSPLPEAQQGEERSPPAKDLDLKGVYLDTGSGPAPLLADLARAEERRIHAPAGIG